MHAHSVLSLTLPLTHWLSLFSSRSLLILLLLSVCLSLHPTEGPQGSASHSHEDAIVCFTPFISIPLSFSLISSSLSLSLADSDITPSSTFTSHSLRKYLITGLDFRPYRINTLCLCFVSFLSPSSGLSCAHSRAHTHVFIHRARFIKLFLRATTCVYSETAPDHAYAKSPSGRKA